VSHLAKHGYHQADMSVPCYFKHDSNSVSFTLVVDDFGIKYSDPAHAQHLLDAICELYPSIKVDWAGAKYLGYQFDWDYENNSVSLSMPNYIPKALQRFSPSKVVRGASSPAIYTSFFPGIKKQQQPQRAAVDKSAPLSAADTKLLQQIIGVYLFYARAVDCTMLTAVNHLASMAPTDKAMAGAQRLIAYSASYPDHRITYRACDMILHVQSDASYLTRSNARSVAGGIAYLGDLHDSVTLNGAIACISTIIKAVCSSATEAEYAALFIVAKQAAWLRTLLTVMGYPQPVTAILCDNEVAVGIANLTVKPKQSKSFDMQYHWVRDQVSQGKLEVYWREGTANIADFFTKALPVHKHQTIKKQLVDVPISDTINLSLNKRASRARANRFAALMMLCDDDDLALAG
jgi:hypothetical protein